MDDPTEASAVSRRRLITGAAAAAALGGVAAATTTSGAAGAAFPALSGPHPEVLGAAVAGLTYLPIDGVDFFTWLTTGTGARYSDNTSGTGVLTPPNSLYAALKIPAGSVVRQFNIAYQGQPIISIEKRTLTTPQTPTQPYGPTSLTAGGGPKTQTLDLSTPVTIESGATYQIKVFCSAGDSIYGMTVGYSAPLQGFVPFTGANPRVLDTRSTGGKLNPGEDRTVSFAAFGSAGARAALFNLAVTETEGAGGYVGCYSASLATWPSNASINWFGTNQNLSNAVTCALSSTGEMKMHGGVAKTHAVVDVVGYLY